VDGLFPFQVVSARKAQRETGEYILRWCTLGSRSWSWLLAGKNLGLETVAPVPLSVGLSAAVWASLQHGGWIPRMTIPGEKQSQMDAISPMT